MSQSTQLNTLAFTTRGHAMSLPDTDSLDLGVPFSIWCYSKHNSATKELTSKCIKDIGTIDVPSLQLTSQETQATPPPNASLLVIVGVTTSEIAQEATSSPLKGPNSKDCRAESSKGPIGTLSPKQPLQSSDLILVGILFNEEKPKLQQLYALVNVKGGLGLRQPFKMAERIVFFLLTFREGTVKSSHIVTSALWKKNITKWSVFFEEEEEKKESEDRENEEEKEDNSEEEEGEEGEDNEDDEMEDV